MLGLLLVLGIIGVNSRADDGWDQAVYGQGFCDVWTTTCGAYGVLADGFATEADCLAKISGADNAQRQCMIYHTLFSSSGAGNGIGVVVQADIDAHCLHGSANNTCADTDYLSNLPTGANFATPYQSMCAAVIPAAGSTPAPSGAQFCIDDADCPTATTSYDGMDDTTRFCWWYHLGVHANDALVAGNTQADFDADTNSHCQHSSGGPDGSLCDMYTAVTDSRAMEFCGLYSGSCGYLGDNTAAGWDVLNWHDQGNCEHGYEDGDFATRFCFQYHFSVWQSSAWGTPDTSHCTHAAGEDPCDPSSPTAISSAEFCAQYQAQCDQTEFTDATMYRYMDSSGMFDMAMCMEAYDGVADADRECYWYHLNVAIGTSDPATDPFVDTGSHCQHASGGPDGSVCTAYVFATPAPTDNASTKGLLLSIIAVLFVFFGN